MIPKVIHYCWFGGKPLPTSAVKCIKSWQKFLPDYELKEWNESNFDVNIIPYTSEAYRLKKYAFVSDYARFWILYRYGGLYFDTDVEVIKPLDDIIDKGPFMGCENSPKKGATMIGVAPGLGLGVNPGLGLYKELLDHYSGLSFIAEQEKDSQMTIVTYTTEVLCKHGLKNSDDIQFVSGIYVYPKEYFCPKDYYTDELTITPNTRTIHHYSATWKSKGDKFKFKVQKILGNRITGIIVKIKHFIKCQN